MKVYAACGHAEARFEKGPMRGEKASLFIRILPSHCG